MLIVETLMKLLTLNRVLNISVDDTTSGFKVLLQW